MKIESVAEVTGMFERDALEDVAAYFLTYEVDNTHDAFDIASLRFGRR